MKKIAFTICAKNYIGLAQVLEKSIKTYNSDINFYIVVADEFTSEKEIGALPANVIIAKDHLDISSEQWYQMAFKYDLTEFCTSIKASCFKFFFKTFEQASCIYFDPDILVFNSLANIFKKLETYSIILTPHITTIEENYREQNESRLLYSGAFNLGFLALKNDKSTAQLLNWWEIRLKDKCFQSRMESLFTDQRWMDLLPSYFPTQLLISSDIGLNMAPWNFHEREVFEKDGSYFVNNRLDTERREIYPLTFVHFSGFNYRSLLNDEIQQVNIIDLEIPVDIKCVFDRYREKLVRSEFLKYVQLEYSYNSFSNQVAISSIYRLLFRRLLEDHKINSDPFDANSEFYSMLQKGGILNKTMAGIDKSTVSDIKGGESKTRFMNKVFRLSCRLIGSKNFFLLVKLMRLYSRIENHVYLIDKSYLRKFKMWK